MSAFLLLGLGGQSAAIAQATAPDIGGQVDAGSFPAPDPVPRPSSLFFGAVLTTNSPGWEVVVPRSEAAGALVLSVAPGSPVEKAGIRLGDVIVAIDGKEVRDDEQVTVAQLSSAADRRLFTLLAPDGRPRTVEVRPAQSKRRVNADYLERKLADDPDIVTRTLAAQVTADSASGLDLSLGLIKDAPSFGQAHALVALHTLRLARSQPGSGRGILPPETLAAVNDEIARAIELDPQSPVIRAQAATIALDLGEGERAESEALRAVQINGSSAQAHHLLGLSRLARQDAPGALPAVHRAAVLNPYQPRYFESLVNTYVALGQEDQAAKTRQSLETTLNTDSTRSYGNNRASVAVALAALVVIALISEVVRRSRATDDEVAPLRPGDQTSRSLAKQLVIVEMLVAVGAWSMATPISAPLLGVTARGPLVTELFGRILPGLTVLALSALAVWRFCRAPDERESLGNAIPVALFLCGLWMTGTQASLVLEAIRSRYPDVAIFRLFPGVSVLVLTVWLNLLVVGPQEEAIDDGPPHRPRSVPATG